MKVLGIIPARGGSKGVPRKNIRLLNGKPLLAYTAEAALRAKKLSRIFLTTEDEEIAAVGKSYGLEVPFLRPANLALDTTPTLPVILHTVESIEATGEIFDAICLLQPTNPLRRAEDIDNCIEMLEMSDADSIISVLPVPHEYNPKWVYWRDESGSMRLSTGDREPPPRRQELPAAFHREGSIYVTRRAVIEIYGNLYGEKVRGYETRVENSINIDTLHDWTMAEVLIKKRADEVLLIASRFTEANL